MVIFEETLDMRHLLSSMLSSLDREHISKQLLSYFTKPLVVPCFEKFNSPRLNLSSSL